ncbi:MAG TPA: amidohydrolase family protein [Thermoanaerobaculia bacterium]|jgi:predicted amidohydrolase YtcJ
MHFEHGLRVHDARTAAGVDDEALVASMRRFAQEQAVIAYTRGSAFAEGMEREKGTIAAGKLADLAVLSQDVFTVAPPELPKTMSVLTMVGGKVVWREGL